MAEATTTETRASTRAFERLQPVADRVDSFARKSGRAAAEGDVGLAAALLAVGGERSSCDVALQAAWSDLLGGQVRAPADMSASVSVLVLLEKITDLAAAICRAIVALGGRGMRDLPSMRRLAELAPEMLRDALGAARDNDSSSAERVLGRGLAVDACFAQAHLDLLQVAKQCQADMTIARHFHALGRALEQIGDTASEIAARVRRPVAVG
jgi:phosphate uptake regulator